MRLFYLCDDLAEIDRVFDFLNRQGIPDRRIHVYGHDEAGIQRHHLHGASPLQTHQVLRFGERGLMWGLGLGLLLAAFLLYHFDYLQRAPLIAGLVIVALVAAHGAWVGGLAGLSTLNPRMKRFIPALRAGSYLLMIDVGRKERDRVVAGLRVFSVQAEGESRSFPLPFSN